MSHLRTEPVPLSEILEVVPLEPIARLIHNRHVTYFHKSPMSHFPEVRTFRDAINLFAWADTTPAEAGMWVKVSVNLDENSPLESYPLYIQDTAKAFFSPLPDLPNLPTEYSIP